MLYECLTAQAEVGVLHLEPIIKGKGATRQALNVAKLVQAGLVADLPEQLSVAETFNEAERCAALLLAD
jgi:hypothetical protein